MLYLTEDERELLQRVRAGDSVAQRKNLPFYCAEWQTVLVERVTASQIILSAGLCYWKRNGKEVGSSSGWSSTEIFPLTDRIQRELGNEHNDTI